MSAQTLTRARSRGLTLALTGALSVAVVAGCTVGLDETETVDEPAPTVEEPQDQTGDAAPTTDAPTTDEPDVPADTAPVDAAPTTEVPTAGEPADDAPDAAPAPGEIPAPGTQFTLDDTVTTHVQAGQPGEEFYGYATVATTITAVEQADPSLFTDAENAADFEGYVPWFVTAEFEWLTYEGTPNSNMIPTLVAFNGSGGELSKVINSTWSAGLPECELTMPDEKKVGETATNCHVFAVPEGEEVGSVGWRGDDYADGGGSPVDNPYYDDPVIWTVG